MPWRARRWRHSPSSPPLVQLGGSSAAPGDPPNLIGDWSAPTAWPIVAVHMSLEPTGQVFALDGFSAGDRTRSISGIPTSGNFIPVPYGRNLFCSGHIQLPDGRTLLVGGHINANEGLADTTIFNPVTRTRTSAAPTWPSAAGTRPRRSSRTDACSSSPATDRPGQPARAIPPSRDVLGQLAAVDLQPDHERVDEPDDGAADLAALPVHVRALGRPGLRRRTRTRSRASSTPRRATWTTVGDEPDRRA